MNTDVSTRNLQIIAALDSLSYGLIYGFISPYIIKLGSSHVPIGILAIGNLLGELLSPEVIKIFSHLKGKRFALFVILNVSQTTHFLMVLTDSYWFTILVRILFSVTNQSQNLCLELLLNKAQDEEHREKLHRNYSFLSGSGYILGPIISGYIFDCGFGYTGILAGSLALVNVTLLMNVSKDSKDANPEHTEKSVLLKTSEKVAKNIDDFKKCNPHKHWDILILKYLFAGGIIIFFSKFTQILKHNYDASSITIGYTGAYINTIVFAATYYVAIAKSKMPSYSTMFICEMAFLLITLFLLLACYAPYYEIFMIVLLPVIFLRTLILTFWKDLFLERKNEFLNELNNSASVVAGLTVPMFFGITCNQIQHNAVILFSCVPMLLCWIILRWHSKYLNIEDENTDDKKDS